MPRFLTPLATKARAKALDRILCAACAGIGGDPLSDTCPFCQASPSEWCPMHRCLECHGRGVVCPECRGMRFHSAGIGQMVATMSTAKDYHQMVNTAIKPCQKCMHTIEGKVSLSISRETDVILAYIADPHNAYWTVRDEEDRQRAEYEALTRQYKPWRKDWGKKRKIVDSTAVVVKERPNNAQAEALLDAIRGIF